LDTGSPSRENRPDDRFAGRIDRGHRLGDECETIFQAPSQTEHSLGSAKIAYKLPAGWFRQNSLIDPALVAQRLVTTQSHMDVIRANRTSGRASATAETACSELEIASK
jgi:hypothetical protein